VPSAGRCALAGIAAALTLAAASAAPAAPPGPRVTLIGDSVATSIQWYPDSYAILQRGVALRAEVAVCRRLAGESCPYEGSVPRTLVEVATEAGTDLGPTVIVALGYNDFEQTFAENVELTLQTLRAAGVRRVLWATLREARSPYTRMNDMLEAAALRHPELAIVDWNRYSRSHPDWFQNDGVHLTVRGGAALATLLRTALDRFVPEARLALGPSRLARARLDQPYAARLTATGGVAPYRWVIRSGSLPKGLRLMRDGRIRGTPTRPGRWSVVVLVSDGVGRTATRRLSLSVAAAAALLGTR
jgi:hypothetical protein